MSDFVSSHFEQRWIILPTKTGVHVCTDDGNIQKILFKDTNAESSKECKCIGSSILTSSGCKCTAGQTRIDVHPYVERAGSGSYHVDIVIIDGRIMISSIFSQKYVHGKLVNEDTLTGVCFT